MRLMSQALSALTAVALATALTPPPAATASAPSPGPAAAEDGCAVAPTHQIAEVQGPGDASPLAGQTVRVEGVVTRDFQEDGELRGFFLQDPTPDADPRTSEGLFAFAGTGLRDVKVGDRVLVTGRATEFNGWTAPCLT